MFMSLAGLETKNDCAGEGQQQLTRQTAQSVLSCIVGSRYLAKTSEQTEDFMHAVVVVIYRVRKSLKLL
jgi:hypothetical protein